MLPHKILPLAAVATLACSAAAATTTSHKVINTVLESGNLGQTLSSGYTTIETAGVKCTYSTCTVSMQIMANVGKATCTSEWAIVGLVDGNSVDGGPLLEALPAAGNVQTHVWQGIYTTGGGYHTLTFQIYLPCSANADQWSVRYLVTAR